MNLKLVTLDSGWLHLAHKNEVVEFNMRSVPSSVCVSKKEMQSNLIQVVTLRLRVVVRSDDAVLPDQPDWPQFGHFFC